MAFFCSLSTLNNFSSSIEDNEEDIMIDSVDEGPRYAYLKCSENGFSSILGGSYNAPKYTLVVFDMFRVFCKHNLNAS